MCIIDTHLPLIYLERFAYPWLDDFPPLKRNASFETYWHQAAELGIEQALHLEVDVARH